MRVLNRWLGEESGQDLAEYAIALAIITLAVVAAIQLVGSNVTTLWNNAATVLQNAAS